MKETRLVSRDTSTSRELARYGSYLLDLSEAGDSVLVALQIMTGENPDHFVANQLVSAGVVSYWRCFSASSERRPLRFADTGVADEGTHLQTKIYRNKTVAHSDSGLHTVQIASGLRRENGTVSVLPAFVLATAQEPPLEFVRLLDQLIQDVIDHVQREIERLRPQLIAELEGMSPEELWNEAAQPSLGLGLAENWDPNSRRAKMQSFHIRLPHEAVD